MSRIDGTCTESFAFDADHYEIASPDVGTSEFSWVADAILSAVAAHQRSMGLAKGIVNEQEIWISAATYIHGLGGTPYQTVDRQSDSMSSYSSDPDRQLEVASKVEFGAHFACSGKKLEPFGALAGGRLLREGTTTYRVESYLRAQRANAKELCFENGLGPYFYESTEAHFTAVIKTRVQVLAPVSDVVIGLEGMPRPDISISVGERQVDVEPIYEIKRSEDGAASYSGTVTFPQLGRDNYLLEMRFRGDMGVIAELTGKDEVSFSGITYIETR
ncbi:hypothetical protein RA20_21560 [Leisingera sp. ANG-Vp]|nr:hypothetical protein RA20_21560 [Leisingera sp. ANG-Vp]